METGFGIGGGVIAIAGLGIIAFAPKGPDFQFAVASGGILALVGVFILILAYIFSK